MQARTFIEWSLLHGMVQCTFTMGLDVAGYLLARYGKAGHIFPFLKGVLKSLQVDSVPSPG